MVSQANTSPGLAPISGATNYGLYVGQAVGATGIARAPWRLSDPFVSGQLIVKHRPGWSTAAPRGTHTLVPARPRDRTSTRFETAGPDLPGLYRLSATAYVPSLPEGARVSSTMRARLATLYRLKTLSQDPAYEYAELNLLHQPHLTPNDAFYSSQWHYPAINLPLAWDSTVGDASVIVAVVEMFVVKPKNPLETFMTGTVVPFVDGLPKPTVAGHSGEFVRGRLGRFVDRICGIGLGFRFGLGFVDRCDQLVPTTSVHSGISPFTRTASLPGLRIRLVASGWASKASRNGL